MNDSPAPPALRPLAVFALIALCLGLSSCQCSWKPDVGPVEEEARIAANRVANNRVVANR
jgi:hypothetical protein